MSPQRPRRKRDLESSNRPSSKRSSKQSSTNQRSKRKRSTESGSRSKSSSSNNGPLFAVIGVAGVIIALMGGYIISQSTNDNASTEQQVVETNPVSPTPSAPIQPKVETVNLTAKTEIPKPEIPTEVEVTLTSNVYGTTFVVRDLSVELKDEKAENLESKVVEVEKATSSKMEASKSVVAESIGGLVSKMKNGLRKTSIPKIQDGLQLISLKKNSLEESIKLDPKKKYSIQAKLEETTSRVIEFEPSKKKKIDIEFSDYEVQKLRKSATCLILMPGGGFGSGFVLETVKRLSLRRIV